MHGNDLPASHRVAESMGLNMSDPVFTGAAAAPSALSEKMQAVLWWVFLGVITAAFVVTLMTADWSGFLVMVMLLGVGWIDRDSGAKKRRAAAVGSDNEKGG